MAQPFRVWAPEGELCGLVDGRTALSKLLAGDPSAEVYSDRGGRHGYVLLADLDAWLSLERRFKLRDYMGRALTVVNQGRQELRSAHYVARFFLGIIENDKP